MSFDIIAPRVDFLDARTGKISREWYLFLRTLWVRIGGNGSVTLEDLINQIPVQDVSSTVAGLNVLRDELWQMPPQVITPEESRMQELEGQLSALRSELAELTKLVQALQLNP